MAKRSRQVKVFVGFFTMLFVCIACACCSRQKTGSANSTNPTPSDIDVLIDYNVALVDKKHVSYCGGTVIYHNQQKKTAYVITAAHCILDDDEEPIKYTFIKDGEHIYRVVVEKLQRESDLALLKTTDRVDKIKVAPVGFLTPRIFESLWIVGCGAGIEDITSHATMSKPNVTSVWSNIPVDIIDGSIYYGNSGGGGVFNDKLELIGVVVQLGPQSSGHGLWAYSVNLNEIWKLVSGLVPMNKQ